MVLPGKLLIGRAPGTYVFPCRVTPHFLGELCRKVGIGVKGRPLLDGICKVMSNKRQAWDYVTVGTATVPIYLDFEIRKGGVRERYRVRKDLGKKRRFKHFYDNPVGARAFAKERATDIDAGHKVARLAEGEALIERALVAQQKANAIGEVDFVTLVETWVEAQLEFEKFALFGAAPRVQSVLWKEIARLKAMVGRKPRLVRDLVPEYQEHLRMERKARNIGGSSHRRAKAGINRLNRAFGSLHVHELTAETLMVYFSNYYADPDEPCYKTIDLGTAINYRSDIHKFLLWSRDIKYALPANEDTAAHPDNCRLPAFRAAAEHKRLKAVRAGEDPLAAARTDSVDVHTSAEVRRILNYAWTHRKYRKWVPVLAIWFFAGLHFTEILQMKWKDIKRKFGEMWVDAIVAGEKHHARTAFFSPAHITWFDPFVDALHGDLDQFIAPDMTPTTTYDTMHTNFLADFRAILAKTNVPFRRNGRRDSFASHMFVLTYNLHWTCDRLGSAQGNFWAHYFHHVERTDAEAYQRIARPGAGNFSRMNLRKWLPASAFQSREQAQKDLDRLAEEERKAKPRRQKRKASKARKS